MSAFVATLAFWLCSCAMLAIGLFISSLFDNTIICAMCSFAAMLIIYFLPTFSSLFSSSAEASLGVFTVICIAIGFIIYKLCAQKSIAIIISAICEGILLFVYFFDYALLEGATYKCAKALSVMSYLDAFTLNNTISIPALIYYLTISALFVFLAIEFEEKRRFA